MLIGCMAQSPSENPSKVLDRFMKGLITQDINQINTTLLSAHQLSPESDGLPFYAATLSDTYEIYDEVISQSQATVMLRIEVTDLKQFYEEHPSLMEQQEALEILKRSKKILKNVKIAFELEQKKWKLASFDEGNWSFFDSLFGVK